MAGVDHALQEIASMSRTELQDRWAKLTGRPVPKLSIAMLRLALGYELQARAKGGLSRTARQQLDGSGDARPQAMPLTPGLRLVREWQGKVHVVTVDDAGAIHWNGQRWKSLSEVARAITGTRWSGPAFFGLKQRKAAA
ncbi:DUF2924 domain-containing protein [Sphingosinicella ginsenosidimutans]|jgi:Protein of unknown function (DUF2924).|uniref:DUF2924 domain-containing protein n=2 Tax=Allosphingosinicella ginsenosidimutans TaxID=1176539 RepID=A0A5C6TYY8_9SPHN|nr:DUF2924 domain-containing protein [Sphingosinicella ginsenosidimutans]